MIVVISDEAEADIADGSWFDELRQAGVDGYFHSCMIADIDSPSVYGGFIKSSMVIIETFPFGFRSRSTTASMIRR